MHYFTKILYCFGTLLLFSKPEALAAAPDTLYHSAFGKLTLYKPSHTPTSIALFISGDGGWEPGTDFMAKNLANQGALVVGIDAKSYKKTIANQSSMCVYPAGDLEQLSMIIQKKYAFPIYLKPILVGYSFGAVLVYGLLAQAPANTFKGAIAIGFCPDIEIRKPLCKGNALTFKTLKEGVSYSLNPVKDLAAPFIALNGVLDQVCAFQPNKEFIQKITRAEMIPLPKVGHGFSVTAHWLPQLITAYKKLASQTSYFSAAYDKPETSNNQKLTKSSSDFPTIAIPAQNQSDLPIVFFVSGDGGWTSFDQTLAEALRARGYPVVGLDAQKYFWKRKTPEILGEAMSQSLTHYSQTWKRKSFVLIGFSFGASVLPFAATRCGDNIKENIKGLICLSPDEISDFEIHVSDMLNLGKKTGDYDVLAEIKKIKTPTPACLFGESEDNEFKTKLSRAGIKVVTLPGGHHYNNRYTELAKAIIMHISP